MCQDVVRDFVVSSSISFSSFSLKYISRMSSFFDPVSDCGWLYAVLLGQVGGGNALLQHLPHYGLLELIWDNIARVVLAAKMYNG